MYAAMGSTAGNRLYYASVPLLAVLWGGNWPAVRIVLEELPPWTMRAGGMALGGLCLMIIALASGQSLAVRRAHWLRLAVAGLLSIGAFNILLSFAQLAGPTSRAAIVTYMMPVWTVLLARFLLREPLDENRRLGLLLGVAGLMVLCWPLVRADGFSAGLVYALLAGFSWALGAIVIKRFPVDAPAVTTVAWQLMLGAACATAGMVLYENPTLPVALKPETVMAFAYHVLLSQAIGYALWIWALSRLPVGTVSLGTLMVPPIGVAGAVLLLGERPTVADLAGLLLMTSAAFVVIAPRRRPPEPGHPPASAR